MIVVGENRLDIPRIVLNRYARVGVLGVQIGTEEINRTVKKLKNRKAAGLDGMKPEWYKILVGSEIVEEALERGYGRVLETGEVPESWKGSRTVMIPKKNKPMAADLRPIAMTDLSYKIMMSVLRQKLEVHIEENGLKRDEQVGFTEGGNILDCLFVLQECVGEIYKRKEEMVVVAVDFRKAFDSIRREGILEIMKELRIAGEVVEIFRKVYGEDRTRIEIRDGMNVDLGVESGIRQGCTASTVIFKLITFKIIEALRRELQGIRVGEDRIRCLFYADDGLLMTRSVEEAERGIRELRRVVGIYGLEMNIRKSEVMIYNKEEKPQQIGGIGVVEEIRYLGVRVQSNRNIFEKQRRDMVNKACLLYTSPSPRDKRQSRMPSSA